MTEASSQPNSAVSTVYHCVASMLNVAHSGTAASAAAAAAGTGCPRGGAGGGGGCSGGAHGGGNAGALGTIRLLEGPPPQRHGSQGGVDRLVLDLDRLDRLLDLDLDRDRLDLDRRDLDRDRLDLDRRDLDLDRRDLAVVGRGARSIPSPPPSPADASGSSRCSS